MKKLIVGTVLLACFVAFGSLALTSSPAEASNAPAVTAPETMTAPSCSTSKATSVYSAKLPIQNAAGTNAVKLAVDESTGVIALAIFQDGKAMGFKGRPGFVLGSHVLRKAKKSFGDIGIAGNSIEVVIYSLDDTSASFSVSFGDGLVNSFVATVENPAAGRTKKPTNAMTMEEEGRGCTMPDGTVVCINVNTDAEWWACFRCCAFSPKGGPACESSAY